MLFNNIIYFLFSLFVCGVSKFSLTYKNIQQHVNIPFCLDNNDEFKRLYVCYLAIEILMPSEAVINDKQALHHCNIFFQVFWRNTFYAELRTTRQNDQKQSGGERRRHRER